MVDSNSDRTKPLVLILNGPNMNLLGVREPEVYGDTTLNQLAMQLDAVAEELGVALHHQQSNSEGALIDILHHASANGVEGVVFNPAAYTHTSIALRDALLATQLPFVEVHLTDISKREAFRHHSYFSDIAIDVVSGLGVGGYTQALKKITTHLRV